MQSFCDRNDAGDAVSQVIHSDVRVLRTQVVLILVLGLVAMGGLWLFVLTPLREEIVLSGDEILNSDEELAAFTAKMEDGALGERLSDAARRNRRLVAEWEALRSRVHTFQGHSALREALPAYDDGRIDFKVALFDAREQLLERAEEAGVTLPEDLGVSETIGTEERAELRLWHLVATVRLVQLAIDARLPAITRIESGVPMAFALDDEAAQMAMEFPTRLVVRCSFKHLVRFLDRLSKEGSFYAVRKLQVACVGIHSAGMLEAEIVAGAILFQVRNGESDSESPDEGPAPGAGRPRARRSRRVRVAQQRREGRYDG
jgi:hypothetical protein